MTSQTEYVWKQRWSFFLAGMLITMICALVEIKFRVEWVMLVSWIALAWVLIWRFFSGPRVRCGFYILGSIAPVVVLIGWLLLGGYVEDWVHRRKFDAELWRNQNATEHDVMWPPRLCMVDDLMGDRRLMGMPRRQVIELLGEPTGACNDDIYYLLEPDRSYFRMDSETLFVRFGTDGKAVQQGLIRD
ncbi:MAG: hypothetical protein WC058_07875 [Phycisphaeraceae bacterium]